VSNGFSGEYQQGGGSTCDVDLHAIAEEYGVKVSTITSEAKKLETEKLEKAKARLAAAIEKGKADAKKQRSQTSAKSKAGKSASKSVAKTV
jgi:DNA-binding MurR/RpiR family transcriptional regulator